MPFPLTPCLVFNQNSWQACGVWNLDINRVIVCANYEAIAIEQLKGALITIIGSHLRVMPCIGLQATYVAGSEFQHKRLIDLV